MKILAFLGGGSGGGIDGVEMRLMAMRSRPEDTRPVEPRAPTNLPDEFFEHKKTDTVCLDGALSPPAVAAGVITDMAKILGTITGLNSFPYHQYHI